jgi:hypothetical protein
VASERKIDVGKRFGRLVILSILTTRKVFAVCDCGTQKIIWRSNLVRRKSPTRSCGCLHREEQPTYARRHGHYKSATYRTWYSMKTRCFNQKSNRYVHYGARGITVCDRWMNFAEFLEDMGERPAGKTLDRINNDGNYEPGNCRWATAKEQASNKQPIERRRRFRIVRQDDGEIGA